jgi:hypothetical protein
LDSSAADGVTVLCRERKAHVPEQFWKIVMKHSHGGKLTEFMWARGRLFDYHVAAILYEMCVQEPLATVTKVRKRGIRVAMHIALARVCVCAHGALSARPSASA